MEKTEFVEFIELSKKFKKRLNEMLEVAYGSGLDFYDTILLDNYTEVVVCKNVNDDTGDYIPYNLITKPNDALARWMKHTIQKQYKAMIDGENERIAIEQQNIDEIDKQMEVYSRTESKVNLKDVCKLKEERDKICRRIDSYRHNIDRFTCIMNKKLDDLKIRVCTERV